MDKTVRIWDPETGKSFGQELKGHAKWVLGLAWEPYHCESVAYGLADLELIAEQYGETELHASRALARTAHAVYGW